MPTCPAQSMSAPTSSRQSRRASLPESVAASSTRHDSTSSSGIRLVRYSPPLLDNDSQPSRLSQARPLPSAPSTPNASENFVLLANKRAQSSSWGSPAEAEEFFDGHDDTAELRDSSGHLSSTATAAAAHNSRQPLSTPSEDWWMSQGNRVSGSSSGQSHPGRSISRSSPADASFSSTSSLSPDASQPRRLPAVGGTDTNTNTNTDLGCSQQPVSPQSSTASSRTPRPTSRRTTHFVSVHSDKTFSLLPLNRTTPGHASPRSFSSSSSHEGLPCDASTSNRPISPPTTLLEPETEPELKPAQSPRTLASSPTQLPDNLLIQSLPTSPSSTSSPSNYRLVGGLRKVPKSPDLRYTTQAVSAWSPPSAPSALPTLPPHSPPDHTPSSPAPPRTPTTTRSPSALLDTPNFRTIAGSSPITSDAFSEPPSSSDSNYKLLGPSSSPAPSPAGDSAPAADQDDNYVLHGDPSPSSSVVVARNHRELAPQFSHESLTVSLRSLRPKSSYETLEYLGARSREALLRTGSLASISTFFTQDAVQAFLSTTTTPATPPINSSNSSAPVSHRDTVVASPSAASAASAAWADGSSMQAHPHQWSSQLSTVASEVENESAFPSRTPSFVSSRLGRKSSGFLSQHSRQLSSISSSLYGNEERPLSPSRSVSESLEVAQPAYFRSLYYRDISNCQPRTEYHPDEHGDGLGDLRDLHHRPSRNRLSTFFSSASSDRNLHSSASSRANSFSSNSLPAWAR